MLSRPVEGSLECDASLHLTIFYAIIIVSLSSWEGNQQAFSPASSPSSVTIYNLPSCIPFHFLLHLLLICTMQKVLFVLPDKISCCTYTVAKPQPGSGRQHSFPSLPLCALSASFLPRLSLPDTRFILILAVIFSDFKKCNFDFFSCYKPSAFKRECRTLLLFTSSLSFTVLNCFLQILFLFSNSFSIFLQHDKILMRLFC